MQGPAGKYDTMPVKPAAKKEDFHEESSFFICILIFQLREAGIREKLESDTMRKKLKIGPDSAICSVFRAGDVLGKSMKSFLWYTAEAILCVGKRKG